MRKICVLGNSHIACLKAGWDAMPQRPADVTLTFFGSPGAGMEDLQLEGRRLVAGADKLRSDLVFTSGGADAVAIDGFDAFLLMGLGFQLPLRDERLSSAVMADSLRGYFAGSLAHRLAGALRQVTDRPIYIGATPFRPTARRRLGEGRWLPAAAVADGLSQAHAADRLRFLAQPAETLQGAWTTRAEFVKDAPRLETAGNVARQADTFGDEQIIHMNADFGRLYLDAFFAQLA